jgi:hypothetical protein
MKVRDRGTFATALPTGRYVGASELLVDKTFHVVSVICTQDERNDLEKWLYDHYDCRMEPFYEFTYGMRRHEARCAMTTVPTTIDKDCVRYIVLFSHEHELEEFVRKFSQ